MPRKHTKHGFASVARFGEKKIEDGREKERIQNICGNYCERAKRWRNKEWIYLFQDGEI